MSPHQSYKPPDGHGGAQSRAPKLPLRQAEPLAMADTENHGAIARECGAVPPATKADAARLCVRCTGVIEPAGEDALVCNAHLYISHDAAHRMHYRCAADLFADGAQVVLCEKYTKNKEHLCGFWASSYPHLTASRHASLRDAGQSCKDKCQPTDIEQRLSLTAGGKWRPLRLFRVFPSCSPSVLSPPAPCTCHDSDLTTRITYQSTKFLIRSQTPAWCNPDCVTP